MLDLHKILQTILASLCTTLHQITTRILTCDNIRLNYYQNNKHKLKH